MIINALYQYYQRLLEDPASGVARPGYNMARISFALNLSPEGELLDIIDLRVTEGKRLLPRNMEVPERLRGTSNISANFMWDNAIYIFGFDTKGEPGRAKECFTSFAQLHTTLLKGVHDPGAQALVAFLENWKPEEAAEHPLLLEYEDALKAGANFVFRLAGTAGFLHKRPALQQVWEDYREERSSDYIGQCLVTGKIAPVPKKHPHIKGVTGAHSTGAALVSCNFDASTSYGKKQSFNAPVSEEVAFGYTTALNYLLQSSNHRLRLGDATTVFWAERPTGQEKDLLAELLDPTVVENNKSAEYSRDPATTQHVRDILKRIRRAQPIAATMLDIDPEARFYILGLSPNAARLAVRFWHIDTIGNLVQRIGQHYCDTELVPMWSQDPPFIPLWQILRETASQRDSARIPPLLGGALMRSILQGIDYPFGLYSTLISRIRADREINYTRAAVIKAYLLRKARLQDDKRKEVMITVSLNEHCTNTAYRLGRLFALLEKAQQDANPGIGATIRDRYFGAASANPGRVFPILLRLAQHHIAKSDYKIAIDKGIEEVVAGINSFPANLNLEEQGLFVLGYYHQRQALYQKKTSEGVLGNDSH
jgi:CRISPR-associated protein Csd1